MSVTTPIFRFGACATDGATDAGAEASADASVDGAATDGAGACDADGEGVAPLVHAESRMAALPNSVRPRERVRMCPPRSSSARLAASHRTLLGPGRSRRSVRPAGGDHRRIVTRWGSAGQAVSPLHDPWPRSRGCAGQG